MPTASMLRRGLTSLGYAVDVAAAGDEALAALAGVEYAALVLDLTLDGARSGATPDGLAVCRAARARGFWGGILILTARSGVADRVRGLDAGADDYLVKPFALDELAARLRALTRRAHGPRPTVLEVGDLRLDPGSRQCWRGQVEIELSRREFAVLEHLMRSPGQVLSRSQLTDGVWDDPDALQSNVVDQYVRYLRRKIDEPFARRDLETVRGVGYRLIASHRR